MRVTEWLDPASVDQKTQRSCVAMDNRATLGDAAWACLRAFVFLLKQIFVSLYESVDAAVARRSLDRIADGSVSTRQEVSEGLRSRGGTELKDICPTCDDFWFEPCPAGISEFKKMTVKNQGKRFYAVRKGTKPGIYSTWRECEEKVKYFSGAEFKSFHKYSDAVRYMEG